MIEDKDVAVVSRAGQASALLHPTRRRILQRLRRPDSAAGVARDLGLPRQKVNYHVRQLEREGLVREVEERRSGNCVERVVRATATHYVIAPQVLEGLDARPEDFGDRVSSGYLVALAARTLREVAQLRALADEAKKRLPTLTLDTEVRFATPGDQSGFAAELTDALTRLVARYHDGDAEDGRSFRVVLTSHPVMPSLPPAEAPPAGTPEGAS